RVDSLILGDNKYACQAPLRTARLAGFNTLLLTNSLEGEASQIGAELAELLRKSALSGEPLARPFCMLAGGETTVHLRGNGKGGRNQEMALAAVNVLDGLPNAVMIPLATDGEDGPTDAAGALVTGETYRRGLAMGLNPDEYLARNDSWSYFSQIGSGLTPGPTGTNVNDICFLIAY
ncbi:MAG: MOFRL family protein, partial [Anaerolineaceae bacterium]